MDTACHRSVQKFTRLGKKRYQTAFGIATNFANGCGLEKKQFGLVASGTKEGAIVHLGGTDSAYSMLTSCVALVQSLRTIPAHQMPKPSDQTAPLSYKTALCTFSRLVTKC